MAPASDLSPAAKTVLDAFLGDSEHTGLQMDDLRENVAAALRAAASQLAYGHTDHPIIDEKALLAIAYELEAQ
jgi:hypothetical protein